MTANGYLAGDPNKVNRSGYVKGDVLAADIAGALQPVPVGPDTDVLTADSVAAEGVDWQAGGGGGGGTPANTVVTEQAFGQASTAGVSALYSRGDHTHGTPTTPAVPAPGGTVVTEQSFGQGTTAGVSALYSRTDHTHGTPAAPTAASVGAVPTTRNVTAGTALTGGGALSADITLNANVGTTAGTLAAGDDSRIVGAQQRSTLTTKGDLYVATASATVTRRAVGADGTVLTADSAQADGVKWATPSSGTSVKITRGAANTSGNVTCANGLPYTQIDTDLVIAASSNDILGVSIQAVINDTGAELVLDMATRVAGADVNYVSSGTGTPLFNGATPAWLQTTIGSGNFPTIFGEVLYQVQAGDISGGNVTLRPYAAGDGGTRAVIRSAAFPLRCWVKNYGPG